MSASDAHATSALAPWSVGDVLDRLLNTVTRRAAFAFGLVLAVAFLGAIAFGAATDIRIVWFDDRGHPTLGVQRSDTQARLDQALRELTDTRQALAIAKAQRQPQAQAPAAKQLDDQTIQRLREYEQQLRQAGDKIAQQARSLALAESQEQKHVTELQARDRIHAGSIARLQALLDEKDRQFSATTALNPYSVARIGDQAYLPLRERPERVSRTLKPIPASATGVQTACKLAVYEDAVFVEATYQGVTGWVSGYYLVAAKSDGNRY